MRCQPLATINTEKCAQSILASYLENGYGLVLELRRHENISPNIVLQPMRVGQFAETRYSCSYARVYGGETV